MNRQQAYWRCGADANGVHDIQFLHTDDEVVTKKPKRQFTLFDLMLFINGLGISLAGWTIENPTLFLIGIAILGLMTMRWMIADNLRAL